jgi:hypothetical protein
MAALAVIGTVFLKPLVIGLGATPTIVPLRQRLFLIPLMIQVFKGLKQE